MPATRKTNGFYPCNVFPAGGATPPDSERLYIERLNSNETEQQAVDRYNAAPSGNKPKLWTLAELTIITDLAIPVYPTELRVTGSTATSVTLAFTDNANNEGGYELERSPNGTSGWTKVGATRPANTTSVTDDTVAAATTYYYRVRALGVGGQPSIYSKTIAQVSTPAGGVTIVTTAPAKVLAEGYTRKESSNEGSLHYKLALAAGETMEIRILNLDGTPVTGATSSPADQNWAGGAWLPKTNFPAETYDARYAVNPAVSGQGILEGVTYLLDRRFSTNPNVVYRRQFVIQPGDVLSAPAPLPDPSAAGGAPASLTATFSGATAIILNWLSGLNAVRYNVQAKLATATAWTTISGSNQTSLTLTHTGLLPNTKYDYQVQSVFANGQTSPWVSASATTPQFSVTITGQNDSTPIADGQSVTLSAVTNAPPSGYEIRWWEKNLSTGTESYRATGLTYPVQGFSGIGGYRYFATLHLAQNGAPELARSGEAAFNRVTYSITSTNQEGDYTLSSGQVATLVATPSGPSDATVRWIRKSGSTETVVGTGIQLLVTGEPAIDNYRYVAALYSASGTELARAAEIALSYDTAPVGGGGGTTIDDYARTSQTFNAPTGTYLPNTSRMNLAYTVAGNGKTYSITDSASPSPAGGNVIIYRVDGHNYTSLSGENFPVGIPLSIIKMETGSGRQYFEQIAQAAWVEYQLIIFPQ